MATEKIGVFGGTFDPIHNGHLNAARAARDTIGLDRVLFVPSARPPHKGTTDESTAEHRLAMTRLAVEGEPSFEVLDVEVARGGSSYTFDTLSDLRARAPGARFTFLLGIDAYNEIGTWYRLPDVLPLCDWAILRRPGYHLPSITEPLGELGRAFVGDDRRGVVRPAPITRIYYVLIPETDVSSSMIRKRVADGLGLAGLVPEPVARYITRHGLYVATSPDGNSLD